MSSTNNWSELEICNEIINEIIINDYHTDLHWLQKTSDERINYSYPMSPLEDLVIERRNQLLKKKRVFTNNIQININNYYRSINSWCKCLSFYFSGEVPYIIYKTDLDNINNIINNDLSNNTANFIDSLQYLLYFADYLNIPHDTTVLDTYNKLSSTQFISFDNEYDEIKDLNLIEQMENVKYWTTIREKAICRLNKYTKT